MAEIPLYTRELQISVGQLLVLWQTKLVMLDGPQPIRQRGRPRILINVAIIIDLLIAYSTIKLCSSKCE